jgi:hypothetical protein
MHTQKILGKAKAKIFKKLIAAICSKQATSSKPEAGGRYARNIRNAKPDQ